MTEKTPHAGGPLIPTISTLDRDAPAANLGHDAASVTDDAFVVRLVVETVIEIDPGSPTTAVVRSVISSPAAVPEERRDNV